MNGENGNLYLGDVYSFAWMHYDTINPKMKNNDLATRRAIVDYTYSSNVQLSELRKRLTKGMTDQGMNSQNSPGRFNEARIIAQALMPAASRISFQSYYKAWCGLKALNLNCPDLGDQVWTAEGNTIGNTAQ